MSSKPPTRRLLPLAAGCVLLAGLGVAGAWLGRRGEAPSPVRPAASSAPTDPRRTYAGPYRNVDPDVRYVGDAQCVGCHEDIAKSFALHPMALSLVPVADLLDRQRYSPDVNNPFTALGRRFQVERQGQEMRHRQADLDDSGKPIVELTQDVHWAIGSGAKGYSYLTEQDGFLLQTPISWYAQKQRWDLSPGFGPSILAGRVVPGSCLFCHANRVREDPDHPDRFEPPVFEGRGIGCERCHGPGELHVRAPADHTIVNPADLAPPLRDAVCEQCHLEGEARILRAGRGLFDYRPGLPMSDFWAVLVPARRNGADARAVTHVEQMVQSKCFQRPVGALQLGCITCHDPHVWVGPAEREAHYRSACLKCHDEAKGQRGCSEALARREQTSPRDSCIACHMPRYSNSDVAHAAATDHRILRRPADHPPGPTTDGDDARFVDFYQDRFPEGDPQAERTRGLGLLKMFGAGMLSPQRHGQQALASLESALGSDPRDFEVHESKAQLLSLLGQPSQALTESQAALAARPGDWRLLALAASAAEAEGQTDLAIDYGRRAVEINPFVPDSQVRLATLLIRTGQRDEAQTRCGKLLQLDPFNVPGRQALIDVLLRQGKIAEARSEFDVVRRLQPLDLPQRERWFLKKMKEQ